MSAEVSAGAEADGAGALAVASLQATLHRLADKVDEMAARQAAEDQLWQAVHTVNLLGAINLTGGAGVFNQPDVWGPRDGYWWDLRRLSAWGFTAGTVTFTRNDPAGEQLAVLGPGAAGQLPGFQQFSGSVFLGARDWIVVTAAGITGTVQIASSAAEVSQQWWPRYIL